MNGWIELLKCLFQVGCFEEGLEYSDHAFEATGGKPVFVIYKSAFLLALGRSKEAMLQLEIAMEKNPKLIKKLTELNPSILQNQAVVELVARYKKRKSI